MLNPPQHEELFPRALCAHCEHPTDGTFLLVTDHAEHVCESCLGTLADHYDWQAAA